MKMTSSVMFLAINAPLPHSSRQHMLFRCNSRTGSMQCGLNKGSSAAFSNELACFIHDDGFST
jgi:hypothetical protein